MLKYIKIIYDREQLILSKRRVFPIAFAFVCITVSLFTLIFINRVLITSRTEGSVNYKEILFLYERIWDIIIVIGVVFIVFMASTSINFDKKCNIINNIMTTKVKSIDIVCGKHISIVFSITYILLATMPMCIMSTFFGGISIVKILLTLVLALLYLSFFASITLMVSSMFYSENWSVVISSILGILFLFINFNFRNVILGNNLYYTLVLIGVFILSILCHVISINSKIFKG